MIKYLVSPGKRVLLLILTLIIGFIITGVCSSVLLNLGGEDRMQAMMRIATVIQDVFMLILPAVVTAMIITRKPAALLAIDSKPSLRVILLAIGVLAVSSPVMSFIIEWNANLHLPESLSGLENILRAMEDSASQSLSLMMGGHTPINLIINILIIGIMAGLSEELLFRGALQRILISTKMSTHLAIWISAILFSTVHFQIFGFVPRMLLGAFFGYMLLWSGSLWLPILLHALNNTLYVCLQYFTGNGEPDMGSAGSSWAGITLSLILTVLGLYLIYKNRKTT